jgi:hypothetical protein
MGLLMKSNYNTHHEKDNILSGNYCIQLWM